MEVYEQKSQEHYELIGRVASGSVAKTAILVPEMGRLFVAVPQQGEREAEVLVFTVR